MGIFVANGLSNDVVGPIESGRALNVIVDGNKIEFSIAGSQVGCY